MTEQMIHTLPTVTMGELVDVFKFAWDEADRNGLEGQRVEAGLRAVLPKVTGGVPLPKVAEHGQIVALPLGSRMGVIEKIAASLYASMCGTSEAAYYNSLYRDQWHNRVARAIPLEFEVIREGSVI